jgi:DNA-binding NtrC family response regulator
MRAILEHLMKMAAYQLPIFLQGESGTGKTTLAQFLHNQSNRQAQPFISCDLSALPGQIIEREIFGVPASASGGGKPGLLDRAKGGTVYLQEIGKLPPIAQQKLYVYLNEKKLPGQARETAPGARVVLGSVQPLSELQAQGDLRQDLAAMMEEFSLRIPPLREREGDIEILAQHFLKQYKLEFQKKVKAFSVEALLILHRYTWPGNIPELQQKIKHGVILADELIEPRHLLPEEMRPEASTADAAKESWLAMKPLRQLCQELARKVERETIQQVLAETRWNKMQAAKLLKINYKTLFNKIKEYGL